MNDVSVFGRRNAMQIRVIGVIFAIVLPVLVLVFGSDQLFRYAALGLHLFGLLFIRWLFFAQAEHVVGLYYGKR